MPELLFIMKTNKKSKFIIVSLIMTLLFSVPYYAAIPTTTPSGRTYTNENGQTYDASAMQSDYDALADYLKNIPDGAGGQSIASVPAGGASFEAYTPRAEINSFMKNDEPDSWFKSQYGFWYYFVNNRRTTKKGWFDDTTDGQRYYLDPDNNGVMLVGWQQIGGDWYYFNERHNTEENWVDIGGGWYESLGKQIIAYGSLIRNDVVDGIAVDTNGRASRAPSR